MKLIIIWHPASETRLNQLMQTLMTHLNAIEKHEKHLDRLVLVTDNRYVETCLKEIGLVQTKH